MSETKNAKNFIDIFSKIIIQMINMLIVVSDCLKELQEIIIK